MTDMTAQDTNVDTLKKTFIALKRAQARVASLEARHTEPIAIVGIACRLPGGANDPDALWSLLCRGEDTAGPIPADRWDESQFYSAAADTPGRTRRGGRMPRRPISSTSRSMPSTRRSSGFRPRKR